jgi:hypothetical protein
MSLLLLLFVCACLFVGRVALLWCFDGFVVVVVVLHERLTDLGCGLFCLVRFSDAVAVSVFRWILCGVGVEGVMVEVEVGV